MPTGDGLDRIEPADKNSKARVAVLTKAVKPEMSGFTSSSPATSRASVAATPFAIASTASAWTLTYAINREYQKVTKDPIGIFDFERTTKSWYLRAMGIDEEMAYVKQPDSIEDAMKDAMKDAIDMINQANPQPPLLPRRYTLGHAPRVCILPVQERMARSVP